LKFSNASSYLLVGTSDNKIIIFELKDFKPLPISFDGHEDQLTHVNYLHEESQILSCSLTSIRIWDAKTGE
jgi:WD40 repeat protein